MRALERRAGGCGTRADLVNTYFDTPDHALAGLDLQLRVRETAGSFVQTVKSAASNGDGRLARGEWEDPVAGAEPDLQAPETGPLLPPAVVDRLSPVFRTEVQRSTVDLTPSPGTHIEAAIDCGRIIAANSGACEPISEIELELKSGPVSALYDVALDLLSVAPVRLWGQGKAERGYQLAAGARAPLGAAHASPIAIDAMMSGDEALRRIGIACIEQILGNEAAVLAGQPEGVHQMRVAVRRLRAVLSAFAKLLPADQRRAVSQELRWLADALAPARNLDVFENSLLVPARAAGAAADGGKALADAVARRRNAAYADADEAVRSIRYTGLLLRQLRWFEGCAWRGATPKDLDRPIGGLADKILERRRRAVQRRAKSIARQSPKARHKLRIALKKQRYATEALAALYPHCDVERFTKRLKRLQDDLGDANDVRVGRGLVAELADPADDGGAIAAAGNHVLDWHEHRLARHERKLRKHLDQLRDAEPFWKS